MAEIWFSSDHHFNHKNIIGFCDRPFADVVEMNERIIDWHNAYVKPQDHWYCLGDVTMERGNRVGHGLGCISRMNGHKRLILGNHDHYDARVYRNYFEKVMAMNVIDGIRFTHIPVHPSSMGRVKANCHGHIHNQDSPSPVVWMNQKPQPYINLCLERTAYRPINLEEVKQRIQESVDEYEEGFTI